MKHYSNRFTVVIAVAALTLFVIGCKEKSNYTISGKISNADGKMIYMEELKINGSLPVDSVKIDKEGNFKFQGSTSIPKFLLLKLSEKNFITLLVDSAEHISVSGDAANFSRDYAVNGSEGSGLVQELTLHLQQTNHKLDSLVSLQTLYKERPGYTRQIKQWQEQSVEIKQQQVNYSMKFVEEHPFSMASVLALYQKFDEQNYVIQDLQSLKVAASALQSIYPKSEHVKALYDNTLDLIRKERKIEVNRLIDKEGQNSPEIILPDVNGKEVALSSFRGKYVLLQFWSARDKGSRILNPVLVANYKNYRRKGFEIYQVSIDKDRSEWLEAIKQDRLIWTNVGDMKGSRDALINYNVQQLPYNYLLDPEGNIMAKDLRGPALTQRLSKIFD